ncbi:PQ-loop domain-containing transporter [Mycoplasmopsis citelli]|uniref:PQ-loop domain-containing transporter n=1 Tax=Mycoplasmopsis citelli TaxID=171281 RepID=UPI0021156B1D|nr:PQ-loop domain-containing transporter [Mycoplasmopsis citelli]UUD36320.1 PQ-loop domain-containing transporter [Mycoplasmopsis citelli]
MNILDTSIAVFGWFTVVLTVGLSFPQLIKLLKERKTQKVNFYSFWILHIGILTWTIFGVLSDSKFPFKLRNVVIADGVSLFVNGIMTYLLYHFYDFNLTKPSKLPVVLQSSQARKLLAFTGVLLTWVIGIIFISLYFSNSTFRISSNAATIFAIIAPSLTTFAFAPQLYTSIKNKNWKGISPMMFIIFELNNFCWIVFWILSISKYGANLDLIGGLIWQIVSFILYGYQLSMVIRFNYFKANNFA